MTDPILIFGPTASGKTDLSIDLALKVSGEIISADSMQVYRFMDIGTAKPSKEQMTTVPHYLIDIVAPDEDWNVSSFIDNTERLIPDIKKKGKIPVIVGGTGLYLNALINGFSFPIAEKDEALRNKLSSKSAEELYAQLCRIDPGSAKKINANDKKRMIRAIEVFESTGTPISKMQKSKKDNRLRLFCINIEREALYKRINDRVDGMIKKGLVDEVRSLLNKGYSKELNSMQALGYKETVQFLEGKISLDEAVELIKRKTRNFAKRQLSWFRRFEDVVWIDPAQVRSILSEIVQRIDR